MLRKLSFLALLTGAAAASAVYAQQTMVVPVPPVEPNAAQAFIYNGGSYLGIQAEEVTKDNFAKFGLSEVRGVAVEKVSENSPAANAGLQNGDVILKFNGEEISSVRKLTRLIQETAPDHQAVLTITRGGGEREITATVGKRKLPEFSNGALNGIFAVPDVPTAPRMPLSPNIQIAPLPPTAQLAPDLNGSQNFLFVRGNARQIGISTSPLTKQLADYFGVSGGGILISGVRENSPAEKAGLKAGDVIVEVDGKKAGNTSDLIQALGEKTEGDVNLTIIRDKNRQTVRVTPEKVKNSRVEIEKMFENAQPLKMENAVPNIQTMPFVQPQAAAPGIL